MSGWLVALAVLRRPQGHVHAEAVPVVIRLPGTTVEVRQEILPPVRYRWHVIVGQRPWCHPLTGAAIFRIARVHEIPRLVVTADGARSLASVK